MKLIAVEFQIADVRSPSPGTFQVTAIGPTTYTFHVFTSGPHPIVISSEILALSESADPRRHAIRELLTSIYYLNKQEIHASANEAR
jgi:hypothetical protein